jgi:hypothetical protein
MLDVFESHDLLGAFVYTFIPPDSRSSKTPKYNPDTAAFSVVKVILEDERDLGSKCRWVAKRAFHATADTIARETGRRDAIRTLDRPSMR